MSATRIVGHISQGCKDGAKDEQKNGWEINLARRDDCGPHQGMTPPMVRQKGSHPHPLPPPLLLIKKKTRTIRSPGKTMTAKMSIYIIKMVARLVKILFHYQQIIGSRHDLAGNLIKSKNYFKIDRPIHNDSS